MQDLILGLQSANTKRNEMRSEMAKITYYSKLFTFIEARFADGETFFVKNYFTDYKKTVKDKDGNDKTIYGLICTNGKSYLGLNDLAFPKRLYRREIKKIGDTETTTYTQIDKKVYQGDLAILFDKFKLEDCFKLKVLLKSIDLLIDDELLFLNTGISKNKGGFGFLC